MISFLEPPELPDEQRTTAQTRFRYEDISQEGRVKLTGLPHALGVSVWQNLLATHPLSRAGNRAGITPILSRMVLEGGEEPVPIQRPAEACGCYQMAHTVDAHGQVNRVILNLWVDLHGTIGLTQGPPPPRAGERTRIGRVFAEHVFTRPFASAEQRKVLALPTPGDGPDADGPLWVPPDRHAWVSPAALLVDPAGTRGATAWVADGEAQVFGLVHTDSNQHVNSLIYPRLFEEALVRALAVRGHQGPPVLARRMEIAFRKPCFAGDRARLHLAVATAPDSDGSVMAAAVLLPEGAPGPTDPDDGGRRAYCTLRAHFRPVLL